MPRTPRRNVPGFVYHLISRFVDREWFISNDDERTRYVTLLGRALSASDWRCLAFGVMSNHIHLAVVAGEQPLDAWVRRVHAPFANWMNERHDRIGVMFVRGPKDRAVAPHRVRDVIAYIHKNPVRAGVVADPAASSWTSHRAYLGMMAAPSWLHLTEGLTRSGFADRAAFAAWVAGSTAGMPDARRIEPEWQFGEATSRHAPTSHDQLASLAIVHATATELGIPIAQLCSSRKSAVERLGRSIAVHCAAQLGVLGTDIAAALDISQQGESVIRRRSIDSTAIHERITRVLRALAPRETGARSA
jgi:REP element-mobilizing transposase RayT